jgi:hypothetical protein
MPDAELGAGSPAALRGPTAARRRYVAVLVLALALLLIPYLVFYVIRVSYRQPIAFNEGWNAYHTERLVAGGPLYPDLRGLPLTPVNYPPLSFLVVGLLNQFIGDPVLTGRILSLISLLAVAALIWGIVSRLTMTRLAPWLAALAWVGLMAELGGVYVGMNEPQMLGHALSTGALFVYATSQERLNARRTCLAAFLCCLALFVKHLLIVAPIVIAVMLAFRNRRQLVIFASAGILVSGLLGFVTWLHTGPALLANFLDVSRQTKGYPCSRPILWDSGMGVSLLLAGLLQLRPRKQWTFGAVYVACAFAWGCITERGAGVTMNVWFDLFISTSILIGFVAEQVIRGSSGEFGLADARQPTGAQSRAAALMLALAFLPFVLNLPRTLPRVLDYEALERREREFEADVELLRSIRGPTLFEEPLLGFEAGKEFVFDPFAGPQLMVAGRLPESVLVDPIRARRFAAIVLTADQKRRLQKLLDEKSAPDAVSTALYQRWTRNALRAVAARYRLLRSDGSFAFYVPRE